MVTRTLSRSLTSFVLACLALVTVNLLVVKPPARANHAASLINCSGSIQACIDAANDGDTILIAAGAYTESLTLSKPISLTGVSSDTTILHAVAGQRVLTVTGATISNSVVISGLTFTDGTADYGGGVLITDSARPLIHSSILFSNAASINGGGVYAQGDLRLMDSRIISNTSNSNGGGVYAAQLLTITGSEFSDNRTISPSQKGGGLYSHLKTWIADSRFTHNSSGYGGGLYTIGPELILTDTDFTANTGGGVIAGEGSHLSQVKVTASGFFSNVNSGLSVNGSLNMTGTQILSNTGPAFLYGAGVGVWDGPVTIVNSRFENNNCSGSGCYAGGISVYPSTTVFPSIVISNSAFVSNSPGGTFVYRGQATVIDSLFERNTNTHDGGGMTLGYQSALTVTGSRFISNTGGTLGGGGIQIIGALTLVNTRFEGNSAPYEGGGIYVNGAPAAYLTNVQFVRNSAGLDGGGAFVGGIAHVVDSLFERNTAWGGGGLSGGGFFISRTLFLSNTAPILGGGIMAIGPLVLSDTQFIDNQCLNANCKGGGLHLQRGGYGEFVNTLFAHNQGHGAAIFLDEDTQTTLRHVTIADADLNPQPAIAILSGTLNLTNTIIANHAIGISNTNGSVTEDYSLFFNTITNTVGVITNGGHSLVGDPRFVDPLHDNYRLQFGSAAIDHGVDAGVYADLDGNPRPTGLGFDIGAYEYTAAIYHTYLPIMMK